MKIIFEDGSFLEMMPSAQDKKLTILLCGFKEYNKLTMASSDLNREQVNEIIKFLTEWNDQKE